MSAHDPFAPPALVGAVPARTQGPEVPDGTVPDVLAWVDGDYDRASQALHAEEQRDKPRSTLVEALEALLTEPEQGEPDL